MKIRYFADTDTMLIEFRDEPVAETRELDEDTILDLDARGNIRSITIEPGSRSWMRLSVPRWPCQARVSAAAPWAPARPWTARTGPASGRAAPCKGEDAAHFCAQGRTTPHDAASGVRSGA